MVARGAFFGVVVVLVAGLLLASSFAAAYYAQDQRDGGAARTYATELNSSAAAYGRLSANYRSALADLNASLSALARTIGVMNTSAPAFSSASLELRGLWARYVNLSAGAGLASESYATSFLLDYGNGTRIWYNDTAVQPGWNLYTVTVVTLGGKVDATWYPAYEEHFVNGVGGVYDSATSSWFYWQHAGNGWQALQTGPDLASVFDGSVYALTFCGFDANYAPACTP
jgi:hypothetical protein